MANAYVDIGNTSIVVWIEDAQGECIQWVVNKKEQSLKQLFDMKMDQWIVSSVVPSVSSMIQSWHISNCHMLSIKDFSFMSIQIQDRHNIGIDRLVNATAAMHLFDGPVIIVDAGTAVTCCYINKNHEYCGGLIMPGFYMAQYALHQNTEQLPFIHFPDTKPDIIGDSTKTAIESGLFHGSMAMVNGVIKQLKENDPLASVILTGGIPSHLLSALTHEIHEPNLPLKGMQWIRENNQMVI